MPLTLQGIEQDVSVALGSGPTGSLAAGGAAAGFVTDVQGTLAQKGAQIGNLLGYLGLSGFLSSAASAANKTTTNQAKSLTQSLFPNLGKYAAWGGLALIVGGVVFKATKSILLLVASLGGVYVVWQYSTPTVPPVAPGPQPAAGGPAAAPSVFSNLTRIFGALGSLKLPTNIFGTSPSAPTNSAPTPLADTNGSPAPGQPTFVGPLEGTAAPAPLVTVAPENVADNTNQVPTYLAAPAQDDQSTSVLDSVDLTGISDTGISG